MRTGRDLGACWALAGPLPTGSFLIGLAANGRMAGSLGE
jgi:hypothetical protein